MFTDKADIIQEKVNFHIEVHIYLVKYVYILMTVLHLYRIYFEKQCV